MLKDLMATAKPYPIFPGEFAGHIFRFGDDPRIQSLLASRLRLCGVPEPRFNAV